MYVLEREKLTTLSSAQDWSALSRNVQWAIIYDLANDHEDGITAAANLLGLTLDDVIKFVNMYVREKVLWENGTYQHEPVQTVGAIFQLDGAQHEIEQPVPEAGADQVMHEYGPDRQDPGVGAIQTITDAEVGPPVLEGAFDFRNEPEVELFHDTNTHVVAGKETGQPVAEKVADRTDVQANNEQSTSVACSPELGLITDSFSREDIGSGRSFLAFAGLQDYADRFGQWFGTGTAFREIPGIFDENNDFIFSAEDTKKALYSGNEITWEGPVPQLEKSSAQREWLMEALPQDPEGPVSLPLQHFQALAERVNGRPIKSGGFLNYVPEGAYDGLRYGKPAPAAAVANILAHNKSGVKEAESLTRKEADGSVGSNVARRNNTKSHGPDGNMPRGMVGGFGDEGGWPFNSSSAMQLRPETPEFDEGIARHFLDSSHVDIDEGYDDTRNSVQQPYSPPFAQLPPFIQPHEGIGYPSGKAVPASSSLGHNISHVASSEQASLAWIGDSSIAKPNPTTSRLIETSSKPEAPPITAEKDTHEASVTVGPASGEATNNAAKSDAEGATESGQFTENGIEIATFPKCYSCFKVRARCDGGRPCKSCITRNRKCKPVTKAALEELPDRAGRVLKDKAKADGMAAQAEKLGTAQSTASTPNAAISAVAASYTATSGVKRKLSAMTEVASTDEDEDDLDNFPPEKEDPTDGDYGLAPKKKKLKKGNTPVGKKQTPGQAKAGVSATPTPTKRRGPYRKGDTSTPKPNKPIIGANITPTRQSAGSASAGNIVTATSAQKASAKSPAAVKAKSSSSSKNAGGNSLLGAGAGRSVNDPAEAVRHAGGQFGMTNPRPVPAGKHDETPKLVQTHSVLDPSSFSHNFSSGAGDSRYLNIPFAPVITRPNTPTGRFVPGAPMTQFPGSVAGLPDASIHASPSWGARPMPVARGQLLPPRPRTTSAGNERPSGAGSPKTASGLKTPMALHEMFPVNTDRMPLVPQIARPGLNGSPGATEISPTSQSSTSGTTASMDFLHVPFTSAQGSPVHRDGSVSGTLRQSSSDRQSMSGFSPNFSAGMLPVGSPTASQRRRSVSSYNHGAHGSGTSVHSSMMEVDPRLAMSPGSMAPYMMFPQQPPTTPRPISRMQQGPGYPIPQQTMHPSRPSGVFYDPQSEEMRPGSRGVGASPARQQHNTAPSRPAKRQADEPLNPGQQPPRKKRRAPASPLAPPREAGSWKELAHSQWSTETQGNQPETANFSVKPLFGGDGSFDVSFSRFTRIHEQIDPELQQTAMAAARKMNKSSAGTDEKL